MASPLLTLTPSGLYCPAGDFYIDPVKPVPRALITHGHSDHARPGHDAVMATEETLAIMAIRCGEGFTLSRQAAEYGKPVGIGGVTVTFHPAGHVLGSAQIAIEGAHNGQRTRIVISGDYKRQRDPTCLPFERVMKSNASCIRNGSFPNAAICLEPIPSARRSAWRRYCAKPAMTGRSICTAPWTG